MTLDGVFVVFVSFFSAFGHSVLSIFNVTADAIGQRLGRKSKFFNSCAQSLIVLVLHLQLQRYNHDD